MYHLQDMQNFSSEFISVVLSHGFKGLKCCTVHINTPCLRPSVVKRPKTKCKFVQHFATPQSTILLVYHITATKQLNVCHPLQVMVVTHMLLSSWPSVLKVPKPPANMVRSSVRAMKCDKTVVCNGKKALLGGLCPTDVETLSQTDNDENRIKRLTLMKNNKQINNSQWNIQLSWDIRFLMNVCSHPCLYIKGHKTDTCLVIGDESMHWGCAVCYLCVQYLCLF